VRRGLPATSGGLGRLVAWGEAQALFVTCICAVVAIILARAPLFLNQDGWLTLVGGRYVATQGLPHHDTLAVLTHGVAWIDQQWLSQLAFYWAHQIGGLALFAILYVALVMSGLGIAIAASQALKGSERHIAWVFPVAAFLYFGGSLQMRTQGFAYPLFAAVLWLLSREVHHGQSQRAYLVFPLLILWANLHGSVTIGAALAVLYGLTLLLEDLRRASQRRTWPRLRGRTAMFLVGPALCLLVTPYGTGILTYYHETLLNPAFGQLVSEWRPITSLPVFAVTFFLLAFAAVWLLRRSGSRTPLFDHLALILLAAAAVIAVRNITWFGLAAVLLLPSAIGSAFPSTRVPKRRPMLNLALAGCSLATLVGVVITVAGKPASWFEHSYDHRALSIVAAAVRRHPQVLIYTDSRFGDWLLWHEPQLAGHISYDIRFELLSNRQLHAIAELGPLPRGGQPDLLAPYGLIVLDSKNHGTARTLSRRPGTRVILHGDGVVVATTGAL
jgi:hypothetical protein